MNPDANRFDEQAATYERRKGLDQAAGAAVARAIRDRFSLGSDDLVVEVGAGTGTIGRHLASLARYVGFDLSHPMLREFQRSHADVTDRLLLLQADGNAAWPIRDRSVSVVFASRAAHLLDAVRVAQEVTRVCRRGGSVVLGRVKREPDSIKSRLRREKRALLSAQGLQPRDGGQRQDGLLARIVADGATPIDTATVARWTIQTTPNAVIDAWEGRGDVGGFRLPADRHAALFNDLRAWARREFGGLDVEASSVESYTIGGVQLPDRETS